MGGTAKNLKEKYRNNVIVQVLRNIAIAGLLFLLLTGCRTNRAITKESVQRISLSNQKMISQLEQKSKNFQTLKVKRADVNIVMNGLQNATRGNIAIYRDSLIVISAIPALGFEALRILCTKDSVIVINRLDKTYYASSFQYYKKRYNIPVGFIELQAIFLNELFYYKGDYKDRIFEKMFQKSNNKNLFIVDAYRDGKKLTNQEFSIDEEGYLLENVSVLDYENRMRINLKYGDFTDVGPIIFPQVISLDILERSNKIQLNIKSGQISFDESINVEFAIPSNYLEEEF